MTNEQVEMLAMAILDGLNQVAEAIAGLGGRLTDDMPLAEYVYQGLEKAARISRSLED